MLKIEVLNRKAELDVFERDGVRREFSKQWCTATVDGLPMSFQISGSVGQEMKPGLYDLDARSFGIVRGRLTLERVVLVPQGEAGKKPA